MTPLAGQAGRFLPYVAGCTRLAFGAAFVLRPAGAATAWAGPAATQPGTQLLTRSMGVPDLLLGVGLLTALRRGDRRTASTWLGHAAAAGVVDAAATVVAYRHLPRTGRLFLLFIAGATLTDGWLAAQLSAPCGASGTNSSAGAGEHPAAAG